MRGERRARWLARHLAPWAALLAAAAAHAATSHHHARTHAAHEAAPPPPPPDVRGELRDQLAAERSSIDEATAAVTAKLAAADAARQHRLAAAARVLTASPSADAGDADDTDRRMAAARRIAAARFLLARDASERSLLADELAHLEAARVRTDAAARQVATISLPIALGRPTAGPIVRHAGLYEQPRAHVELSRRGIEIEVDARAPVVASAAGTVRYAGPIRGLDHCVIVDHGDYETVVARLGDLAVAAGTQVAVGDRLGRATDDRVYFEVRVKLGPGGLPIDPEPLLR